MTSATTESRLIYFFGNGEAEGGSEVKPLVGGKGASLADMTRAGLNVPPGFTISTACCQLYYRQDGNWPEGLQEAVAASVTRLENLVQRSFGRGDNPLLVAVRSGAAQSMPGMMDTILNVGLNPDCVRAMAGRTANPRAAWEAYRHFLVMFGHTVGDIDDAVFTSLIGDLLRETGKGSEQDLDAAEMETLCGRFQAAYREHTDRALPTEPDEMLRQAIDAVFDSWNSERALTYRKHHQIEGLLGTAVNVQMMCPSEVSGVMFTANPVNPALDQMIIESSYGLGEAIVLGKVDPDRFVVSKKTGEILERVISVKKTVIATLAQDGQGQTGSRESASLSDGQVRELAELGQRVADYFQVPCDIEWGLSQGRFYLLQARAIKGAAAAQVGTADEAEREQVRREEIAALQALAEPRGTVWARFNLSEILPAPTPMTWAIVRRFMSGRGGFGRMYRDLGFDPDPALDEQGVFDLVCGRPYCNLSREPRLQYRHMPVEHPFRALKAQPQKALYPQAVYSPARAGWRFWLLMPVKLPVLVWKAVTAELRVRQLSRTFAAHFREGILPAFAAETARGAAEDLSKLETAALLERLEHWTQRTLHDFARDSLKPTVLASLARANLERALAQVVPVANPLDPAAGNTERVQALLGELSMGVHPDPEANLSAAIQDLAAGKLDRPTFVERFGHRASQEMELASPRWSEDTAALDRLAAQGVGPARLAGPASEGAAVSSFDKYGVPPPVRPVLEAEVQTLHTYLALRETAKHYLMRGYALIRRILVELDRRYRLDGGIFYLTPAELRQLASPVAKDVLELIAKRRRRRELALSLPVPQVLFSDDLEAIGRPVDVADADALQGVPLSAGVVEGPALVLLEPGQTVPPGERYILVCPSTDPAWVPLFVHACGLVMETGGVLSHGAIVAREFGLPAVAGLPDIYRRVQTGQRLRIDGATGKVNVLA